ncbi:MAG: CoA pyrophosphatase [Proteobacteria bacterium]|nr:CoA pyrophosphatase [Pseudomonadota bacterium]
MEKRIIRALLQMPPDFSRQRRFVREQADQGSPWGEAGVLLPLCHGDGSGGDAGGWSMILNKRSPDVPQPGDLCFPGGSPEPLADRAGALVYPLLSGITRPGALSRWLWTRLEDAWPLAFFWAASTRECWEEMGVPPWRVAFLGALPGYRMLSRRKIIYPVVGRVAPDALMRLSREIAKVIRVPLADLLNPESYGVYTLDITGEFRKMFPVDTVDVPCFLVRQQDGPDEILWGATFHIVLTFLFAVFGFTPPEGGPVRARAELYPGEAGQPARENGPH